MKTLLGIICFGAWDLLLIRGKDGLFWLFETFMILPELPKSSDHTFTGLHQHRQLNKNSFFFF